MRVQQNQIFHELYQILPSLLYSDRSTFNTAKIKKSRNSISIDPDEKAHYPNLHYLPSSLWILNMVQLEQTIFEILCFLILQGLKDSPTYSFQESDEILCQLPVAGFHCRI